MMSAYFKNQVKELEEYIEDNLEPYDETLESMLEGIDEESHAALALALELTTDNYY